MKFVNRNTEIDRLNATFISGQKQLVVLYGRRRLGKTALLREFSRKHRSFFFSCPLSTSREALRHFQRQLAETFDEPLLRKTRFPGWQEAIEFTFDIAIQQNVPVIFDEFPYLMRSVQGVDTIIQHLWDKTDKKIWIGLCGSLISVMQDRVLGQDAPLYGRRTEIIQLKPMVFSESSLFYPGMSFDNRALWYGFFGGVPAYAEKASLYETPLEAMQKMVLDEDSLLYQEPDFLVREELREPGAYFSALHSLSAGKTRPHEIAQDAGIPHSGINKYLDTLRRMQLIERRVPITEKNIERSTKALYLLSDNFLRFWFRYIFPNRSIIELGRGSTLFERLIKPNLDTFMGPVYESMCHQELITKSIAILGWELLKIGRYWDRQIEIDLVAEDSDQERVAFIECKWGKRVNVARILRELRQKADSISFYAGWDKQFYVMSRTSSKHLNHIHFG